MNTKTALITGASSGLGKEFAKIHAAKGGNLIITARRKQELLLLKEELEKRYPINVLVIEKDLTQTHGAREIYEEVKKQNLQVDYLINNAGFGGIGEFSCRDLEADLNMIRLNILALTELTGLFLPDFVAQNSGKILNISSIASLTAGPLQAVYFATKAYVTSFSNAIAEELRDTKITVTTLLPGPTQTEFGEISGLDKTAVFDTVASVEKVAQDGYNAMLKGKLNSISGVKFLQKTVLKLLPILPKKLVLKKVYKMHEVKN